jgi:hypothetical protein
MKTASIFESRSRVDNSPARHAEGRFNFLDRVAGPVFDRIRGLIEEWFGAFPDAHQSDLRSRLRSKDDRTFIGAFWELYLAESLRRAGFGLTIHPDVPGTSRHPDFLADGPGGGFYLETTIASISDELQAADRRRAVVHDLLDEIASPNFFLGLDIESEGSRPPSTGRLRRDLADWLAGLDPDDLSAISDLETIRQSHSHTWAEAGWSIRFWPIPKSPEHRGKPGRTIGVYSPEGGFIDTKGPLRRAIREKAGRYGHLDRPFVVAVLVEDPFVDDDDVLDALFGSIAVRIPVRVSGPGAAKTVRLRDGSWMTGGGPTRTRVSAVLSAINLAPWSVRRTVPHLWLNPWATSPLIDDLGWRTTLADPLTGHVSNRDAAGDPATAFGLSSDWSGPEEPFPRA